MQATVDRRKREELRESWFFFPLLFFSNLHAHAFCAAVPVGIAHPSMLKSASAGQEVEMASRVKRLRVGVAPAASTGLGSPSLSSSTPAQAPQKERYDPAFQVGCSGWHYTDWRGKFYPLGTRTEDFLPYYAQRFDTVEINNSFYKLPLPDVLKNWSRGAASTNTNFTFAFKISRLVCVTINSVEKKLEYLRNFMRNIIGEDGDGGASPMRLAHQLGPFVVQLRDTAQ